MQNENLHPIQRVFGRSNYDQQLSHELSIQVRKITKDCFKKNLGTVLFAVLHIEPLASEDE